MYMEKAMAPHSSTLAWRIPWTEEPGRLQSMGSQRVRHDWATSLSHTEEGNGNPLQCSCLENPRDEGAWWAAVHGVTQSRTRLKQLSSSSSSSNVCMSVLISQSIPHPPLPLGIHKCSLHLCLYFCFANKLICTIFLGSTYKQYHTICFSLLKTSKEKFFHFVWQSIWQSLGLYDSL